MVPAHTKNQNGGVVMVKITQWLFSVLLVIVVVCAVFTFLAPHFGWRVDAVLSGSMEPALKVGSIEVTKPVSTNDIQAGNIITFRSPGNPQLIVSHRVVAITSEGFVTKGDANRDNDEPVVPPQNVLGKVVFHIPYVGYVIWVVRKPIGFMLALVVPAAVLIIMEIVNIHRELAKETESSTTGPYQRGGRS